MTSWPRVILHFLFSRPTDRSYHASTTLAAFLFGNDVPCALALRLVEVCTGLEDTDQFLNDVYDLYDAWAHTTASRVCAYYNVRLVQHRWLNTPFGPHTAVDPSEGLVGPVLIGFRNLPHIVAMWARLHYHRATAHVFLNYPYSFFCFNHFVISLSYYYYFVFYIILSFYHCTV